MHLRMPRLCLSVSLRGGTPKEVMATHVFTAAGERGGNILHASKDSRIANGSVQGLDYQGFFVAHPRLPWMAMHRLYA
jgi:hypothetical protein